MVSFSAFIIFFLELFHVRFTIPLMHWKKKHHYFFSRFELFSLFVSIDLFHIFSLVFLIQCFLHLWPLFRFSFTFSFSYLFHFVSSSVSLPGFWCASIVTNNWQTVWHFLCWRPPGESPFPQHFWQGGLRKWNANNSVSKRYFSMSDL